MALRNVLILIWGDLQSRAFVGDACPPLSIVTVTFPSWFGRSDRSASRSSFFVRSRTVSPSRPGFRQGAARSRGQDWPQATAGGGREAVLTVASAAPDLARSQEERLLCGLAPHLVFVRGRVARRRYGRVGLESGRLCTASRRLASPYIRSSAVALATLMPHARSRRGPGAMGPI
jgi:hypothetical protein